MNEQLAQMQPIEILSQTMGSILRPWLDLPYQTELPTLKLKEIERRSGLDPNQIKQLLNDQVCLVNSPRGNIYQAIIDYPPEILELAYGKPRLFAQTEYQRSLAPAKILDKLTARLQKNNGQTQRAKDLYGSGLASSPRDLEKTSDFQIKNRLGLRELQVKLYPVDPDNLPVLNGKELAKTERARKKIIGRKVPNSATWVENLRLTPQGNLIPRNKTEASEAIIFENINYRPKQLENITISTERKIAILEIVSPFNKSFCQDLDSEQLDSLFNRYIKALSLVSQMSKSGADNEFLNFVGLAGQQEFFDAQQTRLIVSALVEYGETFENLDQKQQTRAQRGEFLDEVTHFMKVVTGLNFDPKITQDEQLKLKNINRQFLKMVQVLLAKKIARAEIDQNNLYPIVSQESYQAKQTILDQDTIVSQKNRYPYVQFMLNIPGANLKACARLLSSLTTKYPIEIAVSVFLYSVYERYGEININAAIAQIFQRSSGQRDVKLFNFGLGTTEIENNNQQTKLNFLSGDLNYELILEEPLEIYELTNWDEDLAKKSLEKPLTALLSQIPETVSQLSLEFFHIHADEEKISQAQLVSGVLAQAVKKYFAQAVGSIAVSAMPVIDNSHVTDRIDYQAFLENARAYSVDIPEVIFEASLLQQKIGDELAKTIEPERLVRRGNNLYFKINDYEEIELYVGVDRSKPIQGCVLNHIANDIYRLNPDAINVAFSNYLMQYYPYSNLCRDYVASGLNFERFYLEKIGQEFDSQQREILKSQLMSDFYKNLGGYLQEDASQMLNTALTPPLAVLPVQILDSFFDEQGKKYQALLTYLKSRIPKLANFSVYRLSYDQLSGKVKLLNLS